MQLPTFRATVTSTVPVPYEGTGTSRLARSLRGNEIITDYAVRNYGLAVDREDLNMVVSDLISDLLTFVLRAGENPAAVLERAALSFEGDFEDDDPQTSEFS